MVTSAHDELVRLMARTPLVGTSITWIDDAAGELLQLTASSCDYRQVQAILERKTTEESRPHLLKAVTSIVEFLTLQHFMEEEAEVSVSLRELAFALLQGQYGTSHRWEDFDFGLRLHALRQAKHVQALLATKGLL